MWSPAVAGDRLYAVYGCNNPYALDRHNGEVVWRNEKACSGGSFQTAAIYHDKLFVDEAGAFVYDARAGEALRPLPGTIGAPAAYAAGLSVGPEYTHPPPSAGPGHTLVARSVESGKAVWRFRGDGYLDGGPVIAEGRCISARDQA